MQKLCITIGATWLMATVSLAADLPIPAGTDDAFFAERGIRFYAPFDSNLDARYAAGRASPIEPYFEPFYKDQNLAYADGRFGNCVTGNLCLVYDPMRNFTPDRGAVSLWFKPAAGDLWTFFQVHAREAGVGPNSRRQMDLYYATFLFGTSPMLRSGMYRALIRPALDPIDQTFALDELDRNAWHHLVWTWDHTQGMRLFVDGDERVDNWGTASWVQMMTPKIVKLKSMQACDELLLFDRALTEAEALGLYRGELPEPRELAPVAIPRALEMHIAHGYGLDDGGGYPVIEPESPVTISTLHPQDARDGLQPMWFPQDGNRVSCWPTSHIEIANSDRLVIDYGRSVQANYLRVLADDTRFSVETGDGRMLWKDEVRPERDGWEDKLVRRCVLPESVEFNQLVLDRHGSRIGEFWAYDVRSGALDVEDARALTLRPDGMGEIGDYPYEGGVYALYRGSQSPAIGLSRNPAGEKENLKVDPLVPFHLVGEPMATRTGVAGVRLKLALTPPQNRNEAIFRLRIPDPVTKERDLFNADVKMRFDGDAGGPQSFDLSIDLRDIVLEEKKRLWVWLVGRNGTELDLERTSLTLHTIPVAVAAREFVPDAMRLVESTHAYSSEPHPWTRSFKWPGDEHYYYWWSEWAPLVNLIRSGLGADDPIVGTYWHVLRPESRSRYAEYVDYGRNADLRALPYTRPQEPKIDNPTHAPAWALYQRELLEVYLSIVQWWHDERLDDQRGILRGYGDDTQLTGEAFWLYFCTGDEKFRHLLRSVTEGTWKYAGFYRGYPMRTNDVGHNAEEVVGAWPLLTLSEYGNPRYIEMAMESLSLLDFATTRTHLGHRHFKSWYFSASEIVTDGDMGIDNFGNSAFTILGHMLSWYNRNPKLTQFYREWADAWLADFARSREQGLTEPISVRMPSEELVEGVYHRPYTMPHQFLITGLLTGEEKYTDRALSNDDRFFPDFNWRGGQGMLLRDFAFRRHWLHREQFADFPVMKRPHTPFGRWFTSGDRSHLADHYKQKVSAYRRGKLYLYTEGQPSTDRLWGLWDENMFLAYLGGYAAGHRRTSNWPGLALSYADGGTDLASLVLENRTNRMEVLVYNFAENRTSVGMRLWQLQPGRYELSVGTDTEGDGQIDGNATSREISLRRGTRIEIPLRYGELQLIRLRQIEARPEPELLPDLAICRQDLSVEQGKLSVTVHNIGSLSAGSFEVRVRGSEGKVMANKGVDKLEAPVDLKPRTVTVSFGLQAQVTQVEVVPVPAILEITEENNTVTLNESY